MKKNRRLWTGILLMVCLVFSLTGCRIPPEGSEGGVEGMGDILYQTYCEDSYKGYLVDNTAALTFYVDGTYSIGHCTGQDEYKIDTGTWTVEDSKLALYNEEGEKVGNGEGCDPEDRDTWTVWGCYHYDNGDGTTTDYYSTYAFSVKDNGDFTLTVDDQTYYYWGVNYHIESDYTHNFTASEFIEAYNAEYGDSLSEISLDMGTAMPMTYYEKDY